MPDTHQFWEKADCSWSKDSIRLFPTASDTARALFFYAQELGYFKTEVPYFTEREHLNSFLLVYTISGNGILRYNNQKYPLKSGDIFFINCNFYHFYQTVSREPWKFLWIHFNGPQALGYYNEFIRHEEPVISIASDSDIPEWMYGILSLHQDRSVSAELLTSSYLTGILTELLLNAGTDNVYALTTPEYIRDSRIYLEKHFREEIHFDDLSRQLGVSRYHLSREYKKYTGITMQESLMQLRISYAKELLHYSSLSIAEIAYESGMNYPSYFIRCFKRHEGITPMQYRNAWKENVI